MASGARPRTLDPNNRGPLEAWLADAVSAQRVSVTTAELLSGGAVQENWRIEAMVDGGPRAGSHTWVLRTDATARLPVSLDRAGEFAVLQAAHRAGIKVAEPIARCGDAKVIGAPFLVQAFVAGVAQGRKLVRDPALAAFGDALIEEVGAELAKIHQITPDRAQGLAFLPLPMQAPARAEVQKLREALDKASEPRPALEYILSWLDRRAPERRPLSLVHGDYRTGNYMVADRRLVIVLDWEFAHWGDGHEDIGWLCARCWRFGGDQREAGGVGSREAFYRGYDSIARSPLDRPAIAYWEIMALAKWAAIAVLQGDRYRTGGEDAIELALTGLMPPEMEYDALELIATVEASGG